jgi:hypothetical protein
MTAWNLHILKVLLCHTQTVNALGIGAMIAVTLLDFLLCLHF